MSDVAYLYEHVGKTGKTVEIQQVRIKDRRELATREGRYHVAYEVKKTAKASKDDFSQLLKRMHVSDCEEVKLTGRQSRLLEQFVLEMRHRTLQKGDGLVNAVRHALRPGRTLTVNQIYAEAKDQTESNTGKADLRAA